MTPNQMLASRHAQYMAGTVRCGHQKRGDGVVLALGVAQVQENTERHLALVGQVSSAVSRLGAVQGHVLQPRLAFLWPWQHAGITLFTCRNKLTKKQKKKKAHKPTNKQASTPTNEQTNKCTSKTNKQANQRTNTITNNHLTATLCADVCCECAPELHGLVTRRETKTMCGCVANWEMTPLTALRTYW